MAKPSIFMAMRPTLTQGQNEGTIKGKEETLQRKEKKKEKRKRTPTRISYTARN
ncbi:hypothetical protein ACJMK2_040961, partial [Sinanodonta woodiana]